ncbi:hypothetical protein GQX73_g3787 [Xylaria multiplex]|uniref:Uncharacterized protein n=1 Tax=Xylaria multiplex TaxID=323545 RepID=A0A7C8IQK9_9PEZI|nr:hypothetical protein GQX73_g3787 [Xylaria multiplex]
MPTVLPLPVSHQGKRATLGLAGSWSILPPLQLATVSAKAEMRRGGLPAYEIQMPVKLAGAWAAAFGGDLEVLKTWLLKHKYTPFDLQEDGASLLLHAIRGGQKNSVKLLVGYWGGRRVKCDNLTAYHALLSYETSDSHNVDPEDPYLQSLKGIVSSWQDDHDELEPELHRMIRLNSDISQILADDNGSRRLHRCDAWQRTPLALACQIGNVAAARLLIQYQPSNINKSDVLGRTPLMWAVRHDSHETLQSLTDLLLSANCDANLKDKFGLPALYFVLQQRLDNRLLPVLSRLITKTDVRSYNSAPYFEPFHQNPLHWMACSNKTTDAVTERITNMLLDSGARLDAQDARGHVPLQRAIARNNQITVRALTNACRRSVDPPAIDGTAVLYVAATHAKAEILRQLSNADVLWAKMSVKSLDDGEQSPVKTFNRRITTSVELLGGLLRPTVDDVAAFRALVEGIRYRDLPADQQTVGNGMRNLRSNRKRQLQTPDHKASVDTIALPQHRHPSLPAVKRRKLQPQISSSTPAQCKTRLASVSPNRINAEAEAGISLEDRITTWLRDIEPEGRGGRRTTLLDVIDAAAPDAAVDEPEFKDRKGRGTACGTGSRAFARTPTRTSAWSWSWSEPKRRSRF